MAEATKTKFEANKDTGELTITRIFNAPIEKVFNAWASDEAIKQWWGPRTWPTVHSEMDFKVGGGWRYTMQGPDGSQSRGIAVYKEIDAPNRIVYSDAFADADGNIDETKPVTDIELTFEDLGGGRTKLTGYSKYSDPKDLQAVLGFGMEAGLTETLDRLEEYLEQ